MTLRAWILTSRAEKESLGGRLSRVFFAAMRLGEDLGTGIEVLALCMVAMHPLALMALTAG